MKTRCLIVDDEPLAVEVLRAHAAQLPQLEVVASCHNALEAFELLKTEPVDLLFLDIQMPMLTGIDFLRSLPDPPRVIFTTAYREYALEGYELDVVDYLLKPISFQRFFQAINKYEARLQPQKLNQTLAQTSAQSDSPAPSAESRDFVYLKSNKRTYKVRFEDIVYLESLKDYVRVHTRDNRIVTKEKISDLEQQLPEGFLRVHRSYIVNTAAISMFTSHDISLGEVEIPIGISYKARVLAALQ